MAQQRRGYASRRGYANRPVWYAVIVISIVVVVGFALAGYEINHLRTEINGLHAQVQNLNKEVAELLGELFKAAGH